MIFAGFKLAAKDMMCDVNIQKDVEILPTEHSPKRKQFKTALLALSSRAYD